MTDSQRPNFLPVITGIGLTCLLLAALGYLANQRGKASRAGPPALGIVAPSEGMAIDSPLVIRFTSANPLDLRDSGWGHDKFHLHAVVNGVEIMPAARDIVRADSSHYQWTIGGARGAATFHLGWADQAHRPLRQGATDTVTVTIR